MKVALHVVIDLTTEQRDEWCYEYGTDPKDFREDIREHVNGAIADAIGAPGFTNCPRVRDVTVLLPEDRRK